MKKRKNFVTQTRFATRRKLNSSRKLLCFQYSFEIVPSTQKRQSGRPSQPTAVHLRAYPHENYFREESKICRLHLSSKKPEPNPSHQSYCNESGLTEGPKVLIKLRKCIPHTMPGKSFRKPLNSLSEPHKLLRLQEGKNLKAIFHEKEEEFCGADPFRYQTKIKQLQKTSLFPVFVRNSTVNAEKAVWPTQKPTAVHLRAYQHEDYF
ncbi:hypothetical protein Glove_140g192 [Diversispora epigaea]|uniref:Uncharacterized protein n=1 Tax=Diversispora epigaea TaxID=1348612 RepID=A0A397IZF8_9GLOM|nr:hypothetical protein Glove_140g192 [Diversispora epigaea]